MRNYNIGFYDIICTIGHRIIVRKCRTPGYSKYWWSHKVEQIRRSGCIVHFCDSQPLRLYLLPNLVASPSSISWRSQTKAFYPVERALVEFHWVLANIHFIDTDKSLFMQPPAYFWMRNVGLWAKRSFSMLHLEVMISSHDIPSVLFENLFWTAWWRFY